MSGGYLSVDAKFSHGVDDAQEGWDSLCLLSNLRFMDLELEAIVLEILFNLLAIDIVDVQVGYGEDSSPAFIAFGELTVLRVEDSIQESKVIRNPFITIDMETILGLNDRSDQIRHVGIRNKWKRNLDLRSRYL